jgi:hypothetical protein
MRCVRQMWKLIFIMLTYATKKHDEIMVQNHA